MKQNFSMLKAKCLPFMHKYKIVLWTIAMLTSILIVGLVIFFYGKESVILKEDTIIVEVNTELSQDVEDYLDGVKQLDNVAFHFDEVNVKKLGDYEGRITYKDQDYIIKFKVQDTIKPVIETSKDAYTFALSDDLDTINKMINENIKITDNYDKEFDALEAVKEVPTEATEVEVKLTVKDTSGNESEAKVIKITYTDDEESSDAFKDTDNELASDDESPNKDGGASDGKDGSGTGKNPSPTPTQKPKPDPQPTPQPDLNPEQPSTPEYTVPEGALDGGIFNSEAEADAWYESIVMDPNSPYFLWLGQINKLPNGQYHAYLFKG